MLVDQIEQKTKIKFENIHDFETYTNAIDVHYDSEDVIFKEWLYKLNTSEIDTVNRSQCGRGTEFIQDFVE